MNSKNLILWVSGFAGVLLIYSAYKGKHPLAVVQSSLDAANAAPVKASKGAATAPSGPTPTDHGPNSAYAVSYVYDANGNMIGGVPDVYSANPASYIPTRNA